jgi:hypothetical protein
MLPREEVQGLRIFTPVYAVGCPLGNKPLSTAGELTSKAKLVGSQLFWMINAPTFFGNSGGGVYLAKDCRLIGISSMIYTYGKSHPVVVPHMGLFVPLDVIYDWLEHQGYGFIARGETEPAVKESLLSRKVRDKLQLLNDGIRPSRPPAGQPAAGR